MNKTLKYFIILNIFFSFTTCKSSGNTVSGCCAPCCDTCNTQNNCNKCCLDKCDGYPFLAIRSQGRDSSRELIGWQQFVNKYGMDSNYGSFSLAVEYTKTFRPERLTHFFFGNDLVNCCKLLIQGSSPCGDSDSRNSKAWLADYFGLPSEYSSEITFCPSIQNAIVDLNFYWGADEWREGFFFRINAPIVWTKWELCMREKIICSGENGTFVAGYMAEDEIARTNMPTNFSQYMAGNATFGDLKEPLMYGKISNCRCSKIRIADLDFAIGYNFELEEDRHFGIFAYAAAPTGNKPCAKNLFEPVVGNGKHWELGGGVTSSYIFWRSKEYADRYMGMWLEATVAHLFQSRQCRSFDFCDKPNSRYMLLAEIGPNTDEIKLGETSGSATTSDFQYLKKMIPAANWSTFRVGVKIPVQTDIALKFGYVRDNWTFDLGYNLWARTGEKFCTDCCCLDSGEQLAIKGDAYLYGKENTTNTIIPLPISQSAANIKMGDNNTTENTKVDNPQLAWSKNDNAILSITSESQMYGSLDPVLLSRNELNLGKSPSSITHKIFAHLGYAWPDREGATATPFFGIGGMSEFAQDNYNDCCKCDKGCDSCCTPCCKTTRITKGGSTISASSCNTTCSENCNDKCCCKRRGGATQWGIWIKTGCYFD